MTYNFIYRDYVGVVKFPLDDYTEVTAMKPVKKDIDRIFKNYNENQIKPPEKISGEEGQVIWEAEYIQVERV